MSSICGGVLCARTHIRCFVANTGRATDDCATYPCHRIADGMDAVRGGIGGVAQVVGDGVTYLSRSGYVVIRTAAGVGATGEAENDCACAQKCAHLTNVLHSDVVCSCPILGRTELNLTASGVPCVKNSLFWANSQRKAHRVARGFKRQRSLCGAVQIFERDDIRGQFVVAHDQSEARL